MKRFIFLAVFFGVHAILIAQSIERKEAFNVDLIFGGTGSLASGSRIDYYKSYLTVNEPGTEFKGRIAPIFSFTSGIQLRVRPLKALPKLSLKLGVQYQERGFKSIYDAKHTPPGFTYTDVTHYTERYTHRFLTLPFQICYGEKWFVSVGIAPDRHLRSAVKKTLEHNASGNDVYQDGFETTAKIKSRIAKSTMRSSERSITLGAGRQFENWALGLRLTSSDFLFKGNGDDNYKTKTLEFSLFKALSI